MRSRTRRPSGDHGVGSATMPASLSAPRAARTIGLQPVDAEIERRLGVERRHLAGDLAAEGVLEIGRQPVRKIAAHRRRHGGLAEIVAVQRFEKPELLAVEGRRAEAVAVAGLLDRADRPALRQHQRRERAPARVDGQPVAFPLQPPVERGAMAQHRVDMARDRAAVARAREAVAAEIIGDDVVGGRASVVDVVEELDRRRHCAPGSSDQMKRGAVS